MLNIGEGKVERSEQKCATFVFCYEYTSNERSLKTNKAQCKYHKLEMYNRRNVKVFNSNVGRHEYNVNLKI